MSEASRLEAAVASVLAAGYRTGDIMSDGLDVCVTDGFTGNVALKTGAIAVGTVLTPDGDPVAGARVRDLRDAHVEPGRLRPDPRLAEAGDVIRAAHDHADGDWSTALGDIDGIAGDVAVREELEAYVEQRKASMEDAWY